MKIKKINSAKKILTKKEPEKKLVVFLKKRAGRNNSGRITARHRGGGSKRLYRIVDFGQEKLDVPAKVSALEYDPYRTAFIALLEYKDGDKRYRLAADGIKIGEEIICSEKAEIKIGNRMKIKNIPVGTMVYNIELYPGKGGAVVRSAGASARVLAHEEKYVNLEMPSTEIRKFLGDCYATVGSVSHSEWRYTIIGKAGRSRLKGRRPRVRGVAMNPVDHPHGGGEGRSPIGLKYPKTPWGKHALGVKTRRKKKSDKYIIQRRKKKRKK
ncbi:MAG TPA: 50S ribosomal protein L2 [Candidatus Parcubacteria bacterium]|nr:50S ribosomal protein L2 [Candidatus Parcubacteria bacterium]